MNASRVANAVQRSTLPGVALVPRCEIGGGLVIEIRISESRHRWTAPDGRPAKSTEWIRTADQRHIADTRTSMTAISRRPADRLRWPCGRRRPKH